MARHPSKLMYTVYIDSHIQYHLPGKLLFWENKSEPTDHLNAEKLFVSGTPKKKRLVAVSLRPFFLQASGSICQLPKTSLVCEYWLRKRPILRLMSSGCAQNWPPKKLIVGSWNTHLNPDFQPARLDVYSVNLSHLLTSQSLRKNHPAAHHGQRKPALPGSHY